MIACERDWYVNYCENHKEASGSWVFPFPYFKQLELVYGRDRATGAVVEGFKDAIHNMENEQNGESGGDNVGGFHFSLSDDEESDVQFVSQTTSNFTNVTGFNANFETMANVVANAMTDDNNRKKAKSEQLKDVLAELTKLDISSGNVLHATEIFAANKDKLDLFLYLPHQLRMSYVHKLTGQADIKAVVDYHNSLIGRSPRTSKAKTEIIDLETIERIQAAGSSKKEIQKILNKVKRSPSSSEDILQESQDPYDDIDEFLNF
uniref:MLLE-like domain-containing protein n=1 Tax=Tanacetum cinerariifolium TaxID=118510 RepID=A0A6L2LFF2_TANCI|nr:hypothetical protein [Tanacetum cinerariifolium]